MTATTYVRAGKDELIVDVTGADPNSTQTARISLQNGRNPAAGANGPIARRAETWVDTGSFTGGTGNTFGSLAAVTAGGQNVTSRVVDARTAEVHLQARRGRLVPRGRRRPGVGRQRRTADGGDGTTVVVPTTNAAILTIPAAADGTYLIQRPSASTTALATAALTGAPNTSVRHLAQSNAKIGI